MPQAECLSTLPVGLLSLLLFYFLLRFPVSFLSLNAGEGDALDEVALGKKEEDEHGQDHHGRSGHEKRRFASVGCLEKLEGVCERLFSGRGDIDEGTAK